MGLLWHCLVLAQYLALYQRAGPILGGTGSACKYILPGRICQTAMINTLTLKWLEVIACLAQSSISALI
jgi:hypothetical protein